MKKTVRTAIIIAFFVVFFIYLFFQIKYMDQTKLYEKNDELFESSMEKISMLLTDSDSVEITLAGGVYTVENAPSDYVLADDKELSADLYKLEQLGIDRINAYFYPAGSDYDVSSCEVWYEMPDGKRIIYTEKGRLVEKRDMFSDGDTGISTKELRVHWRAAMAKA